MSTISDAENALYKTIEIAVNKTIKTLKITRYYKCEIKQVLSNGKYIVDIDNQKHTLYSSVNIEFILHDKVWVVAPNGDFRDKFICGKRQ